jgi:formylglycine-generating enzyme required for sulfatase activity
MNWSFRQSLAVALGLSFATFIGSLQIIAADDVPTARQIELLKTFNSEFVSITPGTDKFPKSFRMGFDGGDPSEAPAHEVTLKSPFSMAKYEVPQNLYEAVMEKNPSRWKGPRNSVEMFSFGEVVEFCQRATKLMRAAKLLGEDEEIRLPTEAEWEYCCRAGTTTRYSFGDEARKPGDKDNVAKVLNEYGWHTGNAAGNDPPVGALKPNAFGLYDMHGYLWEFVADDWHDTYSGASLDGRAYERKSDEPAAKVIRGGSWKVRFESLTSTARRSVPVDFQSDDLGFRCVKAKVKK